MTVEVTTGVEGDTLCLAAGDGESLGFLEAYDLASLPDPATLTFLPGPSTIESLHFAAFVTDGGAVRGRAARALVPPEGLSRATLAVRHCAEGAPGGFGARAGGSFAALAAPPRMVSFDFDGDGDDELAAMAADQTMVVLRAIDAEAGSRRATELVTDGLLAASGDVDGDCRLDLVAAAGAGALVVVGDGGRSLPPIGPGALGAAIGSVRRSGERGVVLVGASGIDLVTFPGSGAAIAHLADGVRSYVATGRLDGDDLADILASGPTGTVLFLGGTTPRPVSTLPVDVAAGSGPVALGDVDGDGRADVIVAAGPMLYFAIGDGAGGFRATLGATLDADVVRLESGDLDGNCTDDVVALTTSGRTVALSAAGGAVADLGAPPGASVDVALLDADGDGTTELALLGGGGGITLWRP